MGEVPRVEGPGGRLNLPRISDLIYGRTQMLQNEAFSEGWHYLLEPTLPGHPELDSGSVMSKGVRAYGSLASPLLPSLLPQGLKIISPMLSPTGAHPFLCPLAILLIVRPLRGNMLSCSQTGKEWMANLPRPQWLDC